jgi:hypothetical protein
LARVVKYVPAEVVSAYTLLFAPLTSLDIPHDYRPTAAALLIAIFLLVTIAYIWTNAPEGTMRRAHLFVAPLAFLAWAYPISSALLEGWFVGWVAFIAQAVVIALSLFIKPQE